MFGSRSTEEMLTEDVLSSPNEKKTRRDANHILENLIDFDPENEEDSSFIQVFQELSSIGGIDGQITLSSDNLRTLYSHFNSKTNIISFCIIMGIKRLQLFLKHLQQRGHYEIGTNFDYSSIDENDLFKFSDYPSSNLSNKTDPRPVLTSYAPRKLLDSLESATIMFEDSYLLSNGDSTSSSPIIKGHTSSSSGSINFS